jgi:cyclopropane fatty-acyl-phospholipid synthase-like methyltransferase
MRLSAAAGALFTASIIPSMSIGPLGALRLLHGAFSHYPPGPRLHILIRFLTAPFLRLLEPVPRGGRLLDIGGGHGTYALLALEAGAREVVVVEPDTRKSLLPMRHPRVRWVAGFDESVRGTFDAISICDATHRMSIEERTALYRRCFERLAPGGTFLLKDLDPEHKLKQSWARIQDWLSDTFLGISLGEGFIYQTRAEVEATLRGVGFSDVAVHDVGRGYPHPHILYTARKR